MFWNWFVLQNWIKPREEEPESESDEKNDDNVVLLSNYRKDESSD